MLPILNTRCSQSFCHSTYLWFSSFLPFTLGTLLWVLALSLFNFFSSCILYRDYLKLFPLDNLQSQSFISEVWKEEANKRRRKKTWIVWCPGASCVWHVQAAMKCRTKQNDHNVCPCNFKIPADKAKLSSFFVSKWIICFLTIWSIMKLTYRSIFDCIININNGVFVWESFPDLKSVYLKCNYFDIKTIRFALFMQKMLPNIKINKLPERRLIICSVRKESNENEKRSEIFYRH